MPYQTGSSANTSTLIAAIGAFAQTCGWTQHYADSANVIISRGNGYTTRFAALNTSEILVSGQAPYNSGLGPTNQLDQSSNYAANGLTGPYAAFHFFGNAANSVDSFIHVVVQTSGGVFRHFGCGVMRTFGQVITGHYVYATRVDFVNFQRVTRYPFSYLEQDRDMTQIKVLYDGYDRWASSYEQLGFYNYTRQSTTNYNFASGYTQRAVLHQIVPYITRSFGDAVLGIIPAFRLISLQYLTANETMTLGTDQWKVFPVLNRNGASGQENSGLIGLAYKV